LDGGWIPELFVVSVVEIYSASVVTTRLEGFWSKAEQHFTSSIKGHLQTFYE
jgi:hypothetical protein